MLLNGSIINEGTMSAKKVVNYKAEFTYDDMRYPGVIVNLSEDNLYMIAFPTQNPIKLTSGTTLHVKLDSPYKEPICLQCQVTWSYKTPPHGLTQSIGMKIIDSFPNYQHLLKNF